MMPDETPQSSNDIENNDELQGNDVPVNNPLEDELHISNFDDTEPDHFTLNLSPEDETMDVEIISEDLLVAATKQSIEFDAENLDDEDVNESPDELNIQIEDETEVIGVMAIVDSESDEEEEELVIKDYLNEDDGEPYEPDYLKSSAPDMEEDSPSADVIEEEELVIKDYLNEDDGEPDVKGDYLQPPTPEWKLVAQKLQEEREAQRRELIEMRREEDKRVLSQRREEMEKQEVQRQQQESAYKQAWKKRQEEKEQAVEDMMESIREERERKAQERADHEKREGTSRFNYPRPQEREPYLRPSELKRMEREQPKNIVDMTETEQVKPSQAKPEGDDLESRLNRLSKPEEPSDSPSNDDGQGEKGD